jgi:hypothetical protein
MGEIAGFVSKSELDRLRLIREARAIYDSIFPPNDAIGERPDDRAAKGDANGAKGATLEKKSPGASIAVRSPSFPRPLQEACKPAIACVWPTLS